jgi:hypothetical protein
MSVLMVLPYLGIPLYFMNRFTGFLFQKINKGHLVPDQMQAIPLFFFRRSIDRNNCIFR